MTLTVGVSARDVSPSQVLNPYAELGLYAAWIKEELGLPNWHIIVLVILVPHQVIPAVG
jgi:hypothetical protein